jgi:hypothetical protein
MFCGLQSITRHGIIYWITNKPLNVDGLILLQTTAVPNKESGGFAGRQRNKQEGLWAATC